MAIAIAISAVAFSAFCVWLGVRLFNRRERWAKWTAIALTSVVLYGVAYLHMMEPYRFGFQSGFTGFAFAKPTYCWSRGGQFAAPQGIWRLAFLPAFTIHRLVDPDWCFFKAGGHRHLHAHWDANKASAEEAAGLAWRINGSVRPAIDDMYIVIAVLGITFASFCVWLAVRILNRRERWAKWTLAAVVALPVLYMLSFGPACWLVNHRFLPRKATWVAYRPITLLGNDGPEAIARPIYWWARIFEPQDEEENPNNEPPSLLYWQPWDFE
jgi:hypothetical protein